MNAKGFRKNPYHAETRIAQSTIIRLKSAIAQTGATKKNKTTMNITSPAFKNNETLPKKHTCDGENINPPLLISDIPENAKSLMLIFEDPDAPSDTFYHWLVWNISPITTEIPENSIPKDATQGTNSGRTVGYYPPCPPSGTHRYTFKIFALDSELDLPSSTTAKTLYEKTKNSIIDQAEIIGLYSRK